MADKPTLSREYVYIPLTDLNVDVSDLSVTQVAFTAVGIEPAELDWLPAVAVDSTHALYNPNIGESLAILVGPARGDAVTTEDLAEQDWQVWIDAAVTGSDERVVRVAGVLTVSTTGGV